jgi:hypothetical protein
MWWWHLQTPKRMFCLESQVQSSRVPLTCFLREAHGDGVLWGHLGATHTSRRDWESRGSFSWGHCLPFLRRSGNNEGTSSCSLIFDHGAWAAGPAMMKSKPQTLKGHFPSRKILEKSSLYRSFSSKWESCFWRLWKGIIYNWRMMSRNIYEAVVI